LALNELTGEFCNKDREWFADRGIITRADTSEKGRTHFAKEAGGGASSRHWGSKHRGNGTGERINEGRSVSAIVTNMACGLTECLKLLIARETCTVT
jgi:hypothetical protein